MSLYIIYIYKELQTKLNKMNKCAKGYKIILMLLKD